MRLITNNEIALSTFENAVTIADILISEGYVVMISREEQLYILNYEWSSNCADRNDVVFMDRDTFEEKFYENEDEEDKNFREELVRKNTEREVWYYAQKLINTFPSEVEKIFGIDKLSDEERVRFWDLYPDQLSYDEVKAKFTAYNELRNAEIGEKVMEACLADLDKHNEKKYERIMREAECKTEVYVPDSSGIQGNVYPSD
jgi:hypothetical protein